MEKYVKKSLCKCLTWKKWGKHYFLEVEDIIEWSNEGVDNYQVLLLFGSVVHLIQCTVISSKVDQRPGNRKEEELSVQSTNIAALTQGLQATSPLGISPYSLGFYGQRPWATELLLSSFLQNPALQLGYGHIPDNFLLYGSPFYNGDPIIGLILKQYGKYLPYGIGSYNLYSYSVPDTFQPFNSNKYERKLWSGNWSRCSFKLKKM